MSVKRAIGFVKILISNVRLSPMSVYVCRSFISLKTVAKSRQGPLGLLSLSEILSPRSEQPGHPGIQMKGSAVLKQSDSTTSLLSTVRSIHVFYFLPYITCYWIHNLIIIFLLLKVLYRLCLASGSAGCLSLPLLPEDRGDQGEYGHLSMNDSHFLAPFKSLWKINHSNLCNQESSIV